MVAVILYLCSISSSSDIDHDNDLKMNRPSVKHVLCLCVDYCLLCPLVKRDLLMQHMWLVKNTEEYLIMVQKLWWYYETGKKLDIKISEHYFKISCRGLSLHSAVLLNKALYCLSSLLLYFNDSQLYCFGSLSLDSLALFPAAVDSCFLHKLQIN